MERHVRKSEKIVGGGRRGGRERGEGGIGCAVRREREREAEIGKGRVRVVRERRERRREWGEGAAGWKNVGILQQSGWCEEGGRAVEKEGGRAGEKEGGREKCCRKCWNQQHVC